MKRSEVVETIKNLIELNLESLTVISDATLVADLILYKLEQDGMRPPSINNPDWQGGWNSHTHPAYINEWEPEDGLG